MSDRSVLRPAKADANKCFSRLATAIIVLSFAVSLSYDIGYKNKDSGFAIGQWMVAVLGTMLMALYFHLTDAA